MAHGSCKAKAPPPPEITAPKLTRTIRAGPNEGGQIGGGHPGFYRPLIPGAYSFHTCLVCVQAFHICYGVAMISRLLKIVGLFCRTLSLL